MTYLGANAKHANPPAPHTSAPASRYAVSTWYQPGQNTRLSNPIAMPIRHTPARYERLFRTADDDMARAGAGGRL